MTVPVIEAEGISVQFRPYLDRKPTLRRSLARLRQRERSVVKALDDVSFTVEPGEAFGIIGSNGAGKSTLLRVMAGTLRPNSGSMKIRGKTSTLLALGVGFKPELSGRRNVYLGALAAGLRLADVEEMFDSIVEYAELGDAIDRPVKTYSSGMYSRLAFSIGMHFEPDILLLDEVMAVGDERFRRKSMSAMEDLLGRSGTIVYVSHSLRSVEEFCQRTLWLDGGKVRQLGKSDEVIEQYREATVSR